MRISRTLVALCALVALGSNQPARSQAATPPPAAAPKPSPHPAAAKAAPPTKAPAGAGSSAQFGDAHLETDEIDANNQAGDFTMPHRVTMTRPGSDAVGDRAQGNFKKRVVTISGNVVVHQTKPAGSFGKLGEKPSTLTTSELTVDWGNKVYTANGAVKFVQGERTMVAEHGILNETTHDLDLNGNVHIEETDRSASADIVHYNTLSEDVKMSGNVLIRLPAETPAPAAAPAASAAPAKKKGKLHL